MTPDDLRAYRRNLGLTLAELAKLLGTTRLTVWRWENGVHAIPPFLPLALDDIIRRQLWRNPRPTHHEDTP